MIDKLIEWLNTEDAENTLSLNDPNLFITLIEKAASVYKETDDQDKVFSMWTDGSELLVGEEKQANKLCDALSIFFDDHCFGTSYYDPMEDMSEGCVDRYTGWWCIDII